MEFDLKNVLKALLFSTSDPVTVKDAQAVITRASPEPNEDTEGAEPDDRASFPSLLTASQIREAFEEIAAELSQNGGVCLLAREAGGYRIRVAPAYAEWVRLLRDEPKPQKLTPAAMETLAVIAYRQPVTRAEVEAIRGVSADSPLNTLLERELIQVTGRADLPGRPIQYATTDKFLDFCGLRSLDELPASDVLSPSQLTEWIRQATSREEEMSDADMGLPETETEPHG